MQPLERGRLAVSVVAKPGESAMGQLLRAFQANGVTYEQGMRWLGLDRRQALGEGEVAALAWGLHAHADDVRHRLVVLEWRGGGRWVHLAGQRLSRWIAPTSMLAKVCPACLRETGFARIIWLMRSVPACHRHGYSLIRDCANCGNPIRWARPALRICQCGRYIKPVADAVPIETETRAWLRWNEAVLLGDVTAAQDTMCELPLLLRDLSIDGAFRMIEAFGLKENPSDSARGVRHSSASLAAVGRMLVRGIQRLASVGDPDDACRMDFDLVHLPVLHELAQSPSTDVDGQRAAWLLDVHRATRPLAPARVGTRPRRQLPLFL